MAPRASILSMENRAQVVLNTISIGYATVIPERVIHFVQNVDCALAMELAAYNYADPDLLTLASNMFRFSDGPLSAAFGQSESFIDNLRKTISTFPLNLNAACRKKCGLST